MAYELVSAIVQGGCTIIAAKIAVQGALAGLENWRKETPGKRRLEIAEKCLSSAYETHDHIGSYSFRIKMFIRDDLRLGTQLSREERYAIYKELASERNIIARELVDLKATTRIAEIYFGSNLLRASSLMDAYFHNLRECLFRYERLCDITYEKTSEKEAYLERVATLNDGEEKERQNRLRSQPIEHYERVLIPHLGVLATSVVSDRSMSAIRRTARDDR